MWRGKIYKVEKKDNHQINQQRDIEINLEKKDILNSRRIEDSAGIIDFLHGWACFLHFSTKATVETLDSLHQQRPPLATAWARYSNAKPLAKSSYEGFLLLKTAQSETPSVVFSLIFSFCCALLFPICCALKELITNGHSQSEHCLAASTHSVLCVYTALLCIYFRIPIGFETFQASTTTYT